MRIRPVVLGVVCLTLCVTAAVAHDTWLIPRRFTAKPGDVVVLDMTSGDAFAKLDYAVEPGRVRQAFVRLRGHAFALPLGQRKSHALQFRARLKTAGLATAWVTLAPKVLELSDEKVHEYWEDIGASAEIRQRWTALPAPRHWRERYQKFAKTFVLVGMPSGDSSWAKPVGLPLEIVPEQDPSALRAGDSLTVRVLSHGKPIANLPVGAVRDGQVPDKMVPTNADGRVGFRVQAPGRWLVHCTDLRATEAPGLDWESEFATLTIGVGAR